MLPTSNDMTGKVCLVTGSTSGIGKEAAVALAGMGATVVMSGRNAGRCEAARAEVVERSGSSAVEVLLADLASQRQVRELARELAARHDRLDVLVNNAGLTLGERQVTEDGIEATFAVNHMAPFLLTMELRNLLEASAPARVVTVASDAHRGARLDLEDPAAERGYNGWKAYCHSKLANILFTRELARRLEGTGVTANCLHPGVVATGFAARGPWFLRAFFAVARLFLLSPEKGARTIVYLASSAEVEGVSGGYFERCRASTPSNEALDDAASERLWGASEELIAASAR